MDEEYGHLEIRLAKLLADKGMNRNQLSLRAAMNWKQVNNYYNNNISRLDTFVLCKLCTALECDIHDLLIFVPYNKTRKQDTQNDQK